MCLMLAILMLLPLIVACGDDDSTDTGMNTLSEEEKEFLDDLGEYDFDGEDFNVLSVTSAEDTYTKFDVESYDEASNVDMAVYTRNRILEARFNIAFVAEDDNYTNCYKTLQKEVEAGDYVHDLVMLINRDAYSAFINGQIIPAAEIPHLDLSKEYYLQDVNKMCSVDGYNIFAYSEESLYTFQRASVMAYNTSMVKDLGLEDPRTHVNNGTWTLETMFDYMKKAQTVDAFGKTEVYGAYGHYSYLYAAFWFGSGETLLSRTKSGYKFTMGTNETLIDVTDQIVDGIEAGLIAHCSSNTVSAEQFAAEKTLLHSTVIGRLTLLKDIDTFDFGVVPYPKYDTDQNEYASRIVDAWLHVVPLSCGDLDRAGVILEALAGASLQHVFPAYYDEMIKYRILRDPADIDMLEIVRKTRVFDLVDVTWSADTRANIVASVFVNPPLKNLSTVCKSLENVVDGHIKTALDAVNTHRNK